MWPIILFGFPTGNWEMLDIASGNLFVEKQ